ncbi:MAG: hypothetical protein RBT13_02845 [Bacteroidales bacterium]|jgi:hypothetical protein|nr:hypothetical protein [Bacteroidales bacterium]MDD4045202.1 hypothetical protein [Bacteroidales bacterium]MDX9889760.1 hypothetical protein [Bacteroidales bacterium]
MKRSDIFTIVGVIVFLSPFFIFDSVYEFYNDWNRSNPMSMAFLKFAILATFGEVLGLRIKTGKYSAPGFGLFPRAVIWGFLGMWIAAAMGVFRSGVPAFMDKFTVFNGMLVAMSGDFTAMKLLGAFFISVMMNTSFAPVFMTLHKITDTHITNNGGKIGCLLKPIPIRKTIISLNWDVQWNFVFKKTIPFFWIPAHTLTFILPTHMQVLFAALLGVALGVILSIAALKSKA